MFDKLNSAPLYNTSKPDEHVISHKGIRRFGKKIYALIPLAIAIIIAIPLLIPQGAAAIPLTADYQVGEKMVYTTTIAGSFDGQNVTLPATNNTKIESTQTIDVIGFDGEYYSLNHTTTMLLNKKTISFSMLEKMNKTGYSTYVLNMGSNSQEIPNTSPTSSSYLTQLLSNPEVNVGDTINIPYPTSSPNISITGELKMTFKGTENLTVPAGTYKVFRVDITSDNLTFNYIPVTGRSSAATPRAINIDVSYQMFIEYGTMRPIKSTMQETVSYQSETTNYAMHTNMDMALSEHIKP